jgi:hypothetical protein
MPAHAPVGRIVDLNFQIADPAENAWLLYIGFRLTDCQLLRLVFMLG